MKYRRLKTDFVSTDPFTGLFLAAFGNHGPEMLQLQRQLDPDDVSLCPCMNIKPLAFAMTCDSCSPCKISIRGFYTALQHGQKH